MVRSSALAISLLFSTIVSGSAISSGHVIHEKREVSAEGWMKGSRLHPDTKIPLRISLTQQDLERGHEYIMDVSHPSSPNYGKHWTAEEVATAFAPSNETFDKVQDWLASSNISVENILRTAGSLNIGLSIAEVERLLQTEYHSWTHAATGQKSAACDQYHVPNSLKEHIDFVTPGIALLAPTSDERKKKRSLSRRSDSMWEKPKKTGMPSWYHHGHANNSDLENCDQVITPACIKALYHVPPATMSNPTNNLGIFEDGDFYAQEDLNLFFANYTPYIPNGTHPTLDSIDGGYAPVPLADAGGESSLDLQISYPLIYPQGITIFQTDDIYYSSLSNDSLGGYNTWLDAIDGSYCTYSAFGETGDSPIDPTYPDPNPGGYKGALQCGTYSPTNVMSVSYSRQEFDHPVNYQKRQCNDNGPASRSQTPLIDGAERIETAIDVFGFMKLALQGHTILFSSGDTGVAGRPTDPAPNGCLGPNHTIFSPRWPDSCPYLTVVGATQVYPGHTVFEPESVANDPDEAYSSGGGFSNIFGVPDYQASAVAAYFADHNPPYPYYTANESLGANGGLYNRSGRGYPDVSANGMNIAVYVGGNATLEGGTSASTPMFASIVTRINEERLAMNKSTVGFINPVLYSHPEVLNDIKNGSNPGCGTNGFSAVEGWDPLSGLGTPNYPKMLRLFLSLP